MATTTVNEVRVEEGFVRASFGGLDLVINERNGFINATQLCGVRKGRYGESQARKALKLVLTSYYGDLIKQVNPTANHDACVVGTYYHPALLLDLAVWLSPEIYVLSAVIIDAFFNRTDQRKWLLHMAFACEEIPTYEHDPSNCRIRYDGLKLLVNEIAWFQTSDFCSPYGKHVRDFERRKDIAPLLEYFRSRGLFQGVHYHPLLFLRLAAWVDPDFYVKCARVVFCGNDVRLNLMFRKAIAVASVCSGVRSAATSNQSAAKQVAATGCAPSVRHTPIAGDGSTSRARSAATANPVSTNGIAASASSLKVTLTAVPANGSSARARSAAAPAPVTTNGTAAPASSLSVTLTAVPANGSSSRARSAAAPDPPTKNGTAAASSSSRVTSIVAPARLMTNGVAAAGSSSKITPAATPARSATSGITISSVSSLRPATTSAQSTTNAVSATGASSSVVANGERRPMDLSQPSTSSGVAALPRPNLANIIWNDVDEDSEMTVDMSQEEIDHMLTRKEHEVEVARVRRELELAVERERLQKEAALAREREKEAALARVEEEKRAAMERERLKDDQLEALRRQLEDMEISDSRMTLRKRSYAETRANAAATMVNDVGVAGLECLVLFVSTENAIYGYRRQFRNIIPAIHKQLDKVASFVGWFVTNNAVLDYNRVKSLVSDKARECGRVVRCTQNQMELEEADGEDFNLPDTIRTTLRIDLEVIEADVRILARLFNKRTYEDNSVPVDAPRLASSSAFLDRVHRWIQDEHASYMCTVERRQQRRNQTGRR